MSRPYHSISSVKLGMRCAHAWALCYLDGKREPEIAWDDPKAPWLPERLARLTERERKRAYNARSRALGKATHAVLEAWQTLGAPAPDWRSLPGQVALSGAHHVPHPERVHESRVESPIGRVPLSPSTKPDAPKVAYELHGVLWAGFRDLLVSAPAEFIRLKIPAHDGWALYDYKSTASIESYALTPVELAVDPQACLYVAATCDELGLEELPVRWLYLETKKRRASLPVDAVIRRDDAKNTLVSYAVKARELDGITRTQDAPMNTGACGEYGGCYYHVSNGGPCNARRSIGALIQARVPKKDRDMGLTAATKATFEGFKKNGAVPAAESTPEATAGEDPAPAEPVQTTPVQTSLPAAKPRGRKPATTAPAGSLAGTLAELAGQLAEAESARAEADAAIVVLKAKIREACG